MYIQQDMAKLYPFTKWRASHPFLSQFKLQNYTLLRGQVQAKQITKTSKPIRKNSEKKLFNASLADTMKSSILLPSFI